MCLLYYTKTLEIILSYKNVLWIINFYSTELIYTSGLLDNSIITQIEMSSI